MGFVGPNRQFLFARRAPARVGGSAATALQRENEVEHLRSVGQPTDTAATWLPVPAVFPQLAIPAVR